MKTIEEIESEINKINNSTETILLKTKYNNYLSKINLLENKKKQLIKNAEKTELELMVSRIDGFNTSEEVVLYFLKANTEMDRYKEGAKFLKLIGAGDGFGYNPKTNQRSINIKLTKDCEDSLRETINSMEFIIPFIKEIEGVKYISISEYTLSEYGCYSLEVVEKDKKPYKIIKHCYHVRSVEKEFKNLSDCISYIQENHYYKIKGNGW